MASANLNSLRHLEGLITVGLFIFSSDDEDLPNFVQPSHSDVSNVISYNYKIYSGLALFSFISTDKAYADYRGTSS